MRPPGLEPGSLPWEGNILPLDHERVITSEEEKEREEEKKKRRRKELKKKKRKNIRRRKCSQWASNPRP